MQPRVQTSAATAVAECDLAEAVAALLPEHPHHPVEAARTAAVVGAVADGVSTTFCRIRGCAVLIAYELKIYKEVFTDQSIIIPLESRISNRN
jgi:hypothetical protein